MMLGIRWTYAPVRPGRSRKDAIWAEVMHSVCLAPSLIDPTKWGVMHELRSRLAVRKAIRRRTFTVWHDRHFPWTAAALR